MHHRPQVTICNQNIQTTISGISLVELMLVGDALRAVG